jgi:hypothetical protein
MSDVPELLVIDRTYELVKWACPQLARFPRSHRFTLGERIERRLYELLETLIAARYTRERRGLLREANLTLEVLRFQWRLAGELRCVRPTSHAFAVAQFHEIGRMVGGWQRA